MQILKHLTFIYKCVMYIGPFVSLAKFTIYLLGMTVLLLNYFTSTI
jgi:hypothetical protein